MVLEINHPGKTTRNQLLKVKLCFQKSFLNFFKPYLDFHTQKELQLSQPLLPEIYCGTCHYQQWKSFSFCFFAKIHAAATQTLRVEQSKKLIKKADKEICNFHVPRKKILKRACREEKK